MVPAGRGEDRLGVLQPGQQLLTERALRALPHLADGLALQPGQVRQHPAQHELAVAGAGQVLAEAVVEVEQPVVAALHDEDRGEGLGDGPDAELGLRRGRGPGVVGVCCADEPVPHLLAAPDHGGGQPGGPPLGLAIGGHPVQPRGDVPAQRTPVAQPGGQDMSRPAST